MLDDSVVVRKEDEQFYRDHPEAFLRSLNVSYFMSEDNIQPIGLSGWYSPLGKLHDEYDRDMNLMNAIAYSIMHQLKKEGKI